MHMYSLQTVRGHLANTKSTARAILSNSHNRMVSTKSHYFHFNKNPVSCRLSLSSSRRVSILTALLQCARRQLPACSILNNRTPPNKSARWQAIFENRRDDPIFNSVMSVFECYPFSDDPLNRYKQVTLRGHTIFQVQSTRKDA